MSSKVNKEYAFDAYCKRVVKNEAINIHQEYSRQRRREITFSDLSQRELQELQYTDNYFPERRYFTLLGMDVEIIDGDLGQALEAINKSQRDIVLLAYLLDMSDVEIAERLQLNRSTVQYRRTSTLGLLRKIMEESDDERHTR